MERAKLEISKAAEADIEGIWLHIARDSEFYADRFLDQIRSKLRLLLTQPFMGPARTDIAPEARMLVFGNYLILYSLLGEDTVRIYRIVHGARDLSDIWSDGD